MGAALGAFEELIATPFPCLPGLFSGVSPVFGVRFPSRRVFGRSGTGGGGCLVCSPLSSLLHSFFGGREGEVSLRRAGNGEEGEGSLLGDPCRRNRASNCWHVRSCLSRKVWSASNTSPSGSAGLFC